MMYACFQICWSHHSHYDIVDTDGTSKYKLSKLTATSALWANSSIEIFFSELLSQHCYI